MVLKIHQISLAKSWNFVEFRVFLWNFVYKLFVVCYKTIDFTRLSSHGLSWSRNFPEYSRTFYQMLSLVFRIVAVVLFLKLVFDQFVATKSKTLFALIVAIALVNVAYEMREMGCSVSDCSLKTNRAAQQDARGDCDRRLCREGGRVNWRRAYLLAFCVFLVLNFVYPDSFLKNVAIMVCVFALLYFYFNFDAYHRFAIWCPP
jgi:hypothetical protein